MRAPILSRECFYDRMRDGTFRDLDWNLVNTSLGGMMEPRQLSLAAIDIARANLDLQDLSFSRRVEMDEDQLFSMLGTSGPQLPVDFSA